MLRLNNEREIKFFLRVSNKCLFLGACFYYYGIKPYQFTLLIKLACVLFSVSAIGTKYPPLT